MKKFGVKIAAIAALSCVATGVMAKELSAGTFEVDGSTEFGVDSSTASLAATDVDYDTTKFSTAALYYFAPNVGVGIVWEYEKEKATSLGVSETDTTNVIGAKASYNISINDQASIRPKALFAMASVKTDSVDASGTAWGVGVDVSYFPSDYVSFDVGYSHISLSLTDDDLDIDIDSTSSSFGLGVSVYLR